VNDYIIKLRKDENNEKNKGRHFQVAFNPNNLSYNLKDLGNGFGCFMKIRDDVVLKNNCLINLGDSYIVITIEDNGYINLKIFSGLTQLDPM
jgi:hypothetical protein